MIDKANKFGLKGFEVVESSEQGMLSQVARAEKEGKPIVFLGWAPHPMNAKFKLTYLTGGDDVFGPNFGGATVFTNTRAGYTAECPNVGKLLKNLKFSLDMENRSWARSSTTARMPEAAATEWLKANPAAIEPWLAGVTTKDGQRRPAALKERARSLIDRKSKAGHQPRLSISNAHIDSAFRSFSDGSKRPGSPFLRGMADKPSTHPHRRLGESVRRLADDPMPNASSTFFVLLGVIDALDPVGLAGRRIRCSSWPIVTAQLPGALRRSIGAHRLHLSRPAADHQSRLLEGNDGDAGAGAGGHRLSSRMVVGVPLGIAAARRAWLYAAMRPILDLMQTIPTFVYLIPALILFGLGMVPGLIATVIFAIPAPIRLTRLGIISTPPVRWWKRPLPSARRRAGAAQGRAALRHAADHGGPDTDDHAVAVDGGHRRPGRRRRPRRAGRAGAQYRQHRHGLRFRPLHRHSRDHPRPHVPQAARAGEGA
jgi:hypothetical protein